MSSDKRKPIVYLAGPISGQSYDGSVDWRNEAHDALAYDAETGAPLDDGMECVSPMRGKEFLDQLKGTLPANNDGWKGQGFKPLEKELIGQHAIIRRDFWDVARCDMLLANLLPAEETNMVSIGTMFELSLALWFRIPVVVVMNENNIHNHYFVRESAWVVVSTMEEAYAALRMANSSR